MERLELAGYPIGRLPDDLQLTLRCLGLTDAVAGRIARCPWLTAAT